MECEVATILLSTALGFLSHAATIYLTNASHVAFDSSHISVYYGTSFCYLMSYYVLIVVAAFAGNVQIRRLHLWLLCCCFNGQLVVFRWVKCYRLPGPREHWRMPSDVGHWHNKCHKHRQQLTSVPDDCQPQWRQHQQLLHGAEQLQWSIGHWSLAAWYDRLSTLSIGAATTKVEVEMSTKFACRWWGSHKLKRKCFSTDPKPKFLWMIFTIDGHII